MIKFVSMKAMTILAVCQFFSAASVQARSDGAVIAPEIAARTWLVLVDAGEYAASWEESASFFRAAIMAQDGVKAAGGARSSFGSMTGREAELAGDTTMLSGAPDGERVVLKLYTVFVNKAAAAETVTVMKDLDGKWRVAGYFIR